MTIHLLSTNYFWDSAAQLTSKEQLFSLTESCPLQQHCPLKGLMSDKQDNSRDGLCSPLLEQNSATDTAMAFLCGRASSEVFTRTASIPCTEFIEISPAGDHSHSYCFSSTEHLPWGLWSGITTVVTPWNHSKSTCFGRKNFELIRLENSFGKGIRRMLWESAGLQAALTILTNFGYILEQKILCSCGWRTGGNEQRIRMRDPNS